MAEQSTDKDIGALNAKADAASTDIRELRTGQQELQQQIAHTQRNTQQSINSLPAVMEEMLARHVAPLQERLAKVEKTVENVSAIVNRWKGVVAFLAFAAAGLG